MGFFGIDTFDLVLRLPVVLFSLTIHEFMHAWTAWKCGDDTALRAGRVSLSPLAHLDPIGTLCLLIAPIGWAKPVPVNRNNFPYETARRDDILVSGAGIAANFVMGILCGLALRFLGPTLGGMDRLGTILATMLFYGSFINFGLAIFNLIPIPPLDGSHILRNLLPLNAAIAYSRLMPYGTFLLLAFVLGNHYLAGTMGFSLLGYPITMLVRFFTGW